MRRWTIPLLVAAAVAVTVQNFLFFMGGATPTGTQQPDYDLLTGEAAGSDDNGQALLGSVSAEDAYLFVSRLENPDRARNPFLTRLEYDALLGLGATDPQGIGGGRPILEGTLYSAQRRVAWLDGSPYSEGDLVHGFELVRIEPNAVELRSATHNVRIEIDAVPAAPAEDDGDYDSEEKAS